MGRACALTVGDEEQTWRPRAGNESLPPRSADKQDVGKTRGYAEATVGTVLYDGAQKQRGRRRDMGRARCS